MGIVVSIFMLLGFIILSPLPFLNTKTLISNSKIVFFVGRLLFLMGLWNAGWFGLRHWDIFWGIAAIISGVAMMASAVLILMAHKDPWIYPRKVFNSIYTRLQALTLFIGIVLLVSFALYATTLIRLNLGMPIIQ